MKSKVSLAGLVKSIPHIEKIAVGLAIFHDTGKYPDFLGHYGQFENNPQAIDSQLHKMHIALYQSDWTLKTWRLRNGYNRTCDNFVVYVRHFFYSDFYQILKIVTPEAHKNINSLLPELIYMAEQFQALSINQLQNLQQFTNAHEQGKLIKLTS